MTWIDYRHIKHSVPIARLLAYYGIELRSVGDRHLAGPCPLPGHSSFEITQIYVHILPEDLREAAEKLTCLG